MIGVRTDDLDWRSAVAELPASTRLAEEAEGSIVVVSGTADPGLLEKPAVVLLADPVLPAGAVPSAGAPVVVDRAWLRADLVADAGAHPDALLLSAECAAPHGLVGTAVRDAIGWLRVLAGGPLALDAAHATASGAIALLRAGDRAATLCVTVLADPAARSHLRALAVGVERVEVTTDDAGAASVSVSSPAGELALPTRFESRQRVALRRALQAASQGSTADLEELRHDEELAADVLLAYKRALSPA